MSQRVYNSIILAALLAFAFGMVGCQGVRPAAASRAAGNALGKLDDVSADLARLQGHTDQFGEGTRQSAVETLNDVRTKDMPVLEKAGEALAKSQGELTAERSHWLGYRARVWMHWIVGIGAALIALQVLLAAFGGMAGAGWIATFAGGVSRVIGLIVPVFGALVNWVAQAFIHARQLALAKVTSTITTTATAPAAVPAPATQPIP